MFCLRFCIAAEAPQHHSSEDARVRLRHFHKVLADSTGEAWGEVSRQSKASEKPGFGIEGTIELPCVPVWCLHARVLPCCCLKFSTLIRLANKPTGETQTQEFPHHKPSLSWRKVAGKEETITSSRALASHRA